MKRKLTITYEFDDVPWFNEDIGEECPTDAIAYAMDQVNQTVPRSSADFIEAKLDDEILVDGTGYVSDKVKAYAMQYNVFVRKVLGVRDNG